MDGGAPRFVQLYIYDTDTDVRNRLANLDSRCGHALREDFVQGLIHFVDHNNALVQFEISCSLGPYLHIRNFLLVLQNKQLLIWICVLLIDYMEHTRLRRRVYRYQGKGHPDVKDFERSHLVFVTVGSDSFDVITNAVKSMDRHLQTFAHCERNYFLTSKLLLLP